MRNSVFAAVLLVLVLGCGSAWAADPAAATYNWTGFYAGAERRRSQEQLRVYH